MPQNLQFPISLFPENFLDATFLSSYLWCLADSSFPTNTSHLNLFFASSLTSFRIQFHFSFVSTYITEDRMRAFDLS